MPHLVIEYSNDIVSEASPEKLIEASWEGAKASNLFEANRIKVRGKEFDNYLVGGVKAPFVHTTVYLISGRSLEQKKDLAEAIYSRQKALLNSVKSLTVDVRDLDSTVYRK